MIQKEQHEGVLLALDTATRNTGYAISKNGQLIASGVWRLKPTRNLAELYGHLTTTIEQYHVTEIVAEDIYKDDKHHMAFERLAECRGVVECVGQQTDTPVLFINPIAVKQTVWGYNPRHATHKAFTRAQQKQFMVRAVTRAGFTLNTDKDDEADAIGLLIARLGRQYNPLEPSQRI